MARHLFGAGIADVVVKRDGSRRLYAGAGQVLAFYAAETGGAPLTDLEDVDNTPISSVTSLSDGRVPAFYGPDEVAELWVSWDGGVTRQRMVATIAAALELHTHDEADVTGLAADLAGKADAADLTALDAATTAALAGKADDSDVTALTATVAGKAPLQEAVNVVATAGASQTLPDVTTATIHRLTLTAATCTLTFPAAGAGKSLTVVLVQDATGSRAVTWPAEVKWPGGTAPTLTTTASKRDVFSFLCADGTNWLGFTAGQAFA